MPFLTDDEVKLTTDGPRRFKLLEPLTYVGDEGTYVVPATFGTDLTSTPFFATWLVPKYGVHTKAALVHDYLWDLGRKGAFSFTRADTIFRQALRELGVPVWRRYVMWGAVRLASLFKHGAWRDTPPKQWVGLPVLWATTTGVLGALVLSLSHAVVWLSRVVT